MIISILRILLINFEQCGFETHIDVSYAKARRYRQMCSTYPIRSKTDQPPILPTSNASSSNWTASSQAQASASASKGKSAHNLQQRSAIAKSRSALPESQALGLNANIVPQNNPASEYVHWCVDTAPQRTLLHEICKEKKKGKDLSTSYVEAIEEFAVGDGTSP